MAPNGGRAVACIRVNGSSARAESPGSSGRGAPPHGPPVPPRSPRVYTANPPSAGMLPDGYGIWNASPPGWSMRSTHVLPWPPGRLDVNSRCRPSCVQRGFVLDTPGAV
jgi:hypothetical protein